MLETTLGVKAEIEAEEILKEVFEEKDVKRTVILLRVEVQLDLQNIQSLHAMHTIRPYTLPHRLFHVKRSQP